MADSDRDRPMRRNGGRPAPGADYSLGPPADPDESPGREPQSEAPAAPKTGFSPPRARPESAPNSHERLGRRPDSRDPFDSLLESLDSPSESGERSDSPRGSRPSRGDDSYTLASSDSGMESVPRYSIPDYPDEEGEGTADRPALAEIGQAPPAPPPPPPEPETHQVSLAGLIVLVACCGVMFAVGRLLPPRLFAALAGLATILGLKLLPALNPTSGFLRLARWLLVATYFIAAALALVFTEGKPY